MNIVSTFRALDYDLKTYGFWPQNLIAVLLIFVLVHGIFNSLTLDPTHVSQAVNLLAIEAKPIQASPTAG